MLKISALMGFRLVVMGCGGGSSGGGVAGNSGGNTSGGSAQQTLSAKLQYKDRCGTITPASDAALIIHNTDLSNDKVIFANANGEVSYQTSASTTTFSTIMYDKNLVANTHPLSMQTFIDHPIINVGEITLNTQDDSTCICQTSELKVTLPDPSASVQTATLRGARSYSSGIKQMGSVTFANVEYCKNSEGQWPLISVFANTFQNEAFGAMVKNIAEVTEVNATLQGIPVLVDSDTTYRQASTVVNGQYYFRNNVSNFPDDVYGFEADDVDFYLIDAYDFEDIYGVEGVDSAYVLTVSSVSTNDLSQSYYLSKPYVDYTELTKILDAPGSYAIEANYGYDYVFVNLNANSSGKALFSWQLTAPLSGNALDFDKINIDQFMNESVLDAYVDNTEIDLGVSGYEGIDNYQEYLNKIVDKKPSDGSSPLWSKSADLILHISLSGSALSGLNSAMSINNVAYGERKLRVKPEPVNR